MIIDQIANYQQYYPLHPRIKPAFDFLNQTDLASLHTGRHEIDGENIYAMLQNYTSKPREQGFWEAHRRYLDLQVMIEGVELIGYANITHLSQATYDPVKDFLPLFGQGNFLTLQNGSFALLFPQDAHMPGIAHAIPAPVKKLVIKISIL
jgi:YhcH/YjgK/YiaL family protein